MKALGLLLVSEHFRELMGASLTVFKINFLQSFDVVLLENTKECQSFMCFFLNFFLFRRLDVVFCNVSRPLYEVRAGNVKLKLKKGEIGKELRKEADKLQDLRRFPAFYFFEARAVYGVGNTTVPVASPRT